MGQIKNIKLHIVTDIKHFSMNTSMNASFVTPTQPSLKGGQIPAGHIILNPKFRTTPLTKHIPEYNCKVLYDDTIGLIDCYPSNKCAVIIIQEAELIAQTEVRKKVRELKKFPHSKVAVVEVTETAQQYFKELQDQLTFTEDVLIQLLPVGNMKEAALLITQLTHTEKQGNPFTQKPKGKVVLEESILELVQSFPGVGGKKAVDLLTTFRTIQNICSQSVESLTKVVGKSTAESIVKMVNGRT